MGDPTQLNFMIRKERLLLFLVFRYCKILFDPTVFDFGGSIFYQPTFIIG